MISKVNINIHKVNIIQNVFESNLERIRTPVSNIIEKGCLKYFIILKTGVG